MRNEVLTISVLRHASIAIALLLIPIEFYLRSIFSLTVSSGGWVGNLVVYLITKYNVKSIDATQVNNVVLGCLSFFPIAGAIISDSFYGSFPVIVFFSIVSLMQIGAGHVLNVVAMVSSAFLEVQRLHVARVHHLMGARTGVTTIVPFSALWLVGPLTVLGIGEALHFPAQVSLYYQEFPTSLRNTSTAMISLLIASGFYVSTAITSLIRNNTGWLMDDINNGRLDIVYSVLAAIGALNFGYFLICAKTFQHKLDYHDHNLADVSSS
ncbi:NRT1/ PTR family 2.7-like protein [Tanacetum coccineum]